jgi:hypothetical protein
MLTEKEAEERVKRNAQPLGSRSAATAGAAQDLSRAYGGVWWDAEAKIAPRPADGS